MSFIYFISICLILCQFSSAALFPTAKNNDYKVIQTGNRRYTVFGTRTFGSDITSMVSSLKNPSNQGLCRKLLLVQRHAYGNHQATKDIVGSTLFSTYYGRKEYFVVPDKKTLVEPGKSALEDLNLLRHPSRVNNNLDSVGNLRKLDKKGKLIYEVRLLDPALTIKGVLQCNKFANNIEKLGESINNWKPNILMVSPMVRTLQTATYGWWRDNISKLRNIFIMDELRERASTLVSDVLQPRQKTLSELPWIQNWQYFTAKEAKTIGVLKSNLKFETITELKLRAKRFLDILFKDPSFRDQKRIGIVSHGGFLQKGLLSYLSLETPEFQNVELRALVVEGKCSRS